MHLAIAFQCLPSGPSHRLLDSPIPSIPKPESSCTVLALLHLYN